MCFFAVTDLNWSCFFFSSSLVTDDIVSVISLDDDVVSVIPLSEWGVGVK